MKKLSNLGIAELELEALFAGKLWAYVAVIPPKGPGAALGIAVANEAGYHPIPLNWCWGDNYLDMEKHADELNNERGMSVHEAASIIASSMSKRAG